MDSQVLKQLVRQLITSCMDELAGFDLMNHPEQAQAIANTKSLIDSFTTDSKNKGFDLAQLSGCAVQIGLVWQGCNIYLKNPTCSGLPLINQISEALEITLSELETA